MPRKQAEQPEAAAVSSIVKVRVFPAKSAHLVEFYYEPLGGNGEILSVSEGFSRREDAIRAATDAYPGVELQIER